MERKVDKVLQLKSSSTVTPDLSIASKSESRQASYSDSLSPLPFTTSPPTLESVECGPCSPVPGIRDDSENITGDAGGLRMIHIGDLQVMFKNESLPESPPSISYSDVDLLIHDWYHSSHIRLGDQGIPLQYWNQLYSKQRGSSGLAWKSFRHTWNNWKVCEISSQCCVCQ